MVTFFFFRVASSQLAVMELAFLYNIMVDKPTDGISMHFIYRIIGIRFSQAPILKTTKTKCVPHF